MFDLKISGEEKLLISVLFNNKNQIEKEIDFDKIDYDLLVKIASAHLMLPSLYTNLKNKGFIYLIPSELKIYLEEIFNINSNRNKILLIEAKEISKKLIDNDINHVFLKGTSHLLNDIYDQLGERMIGDVDILVSKKDFNKTIELLQNSNYRGSKPMTSYAKHYDRLINPKKMFAIEIHIRLLYGRKKISSELVLKTKIATSKNFFSASNEYNLLHNIYNFQINDFGSNKLSYSYRSFYDTYMLIKHYNINLGKIKLDCYINNYMMIAKELKIPNIEFSKIQINKLNLFRFKLKYINKLYFVFDNFIFDTINFIKLKRKQTIEIFINSNFRQYAIKKILNKQ